ncbi:MAG TPA: ComF family protein, partial [Thermoanaerobacterales bacterium]|nr:ComF family protein [Thermoanaerobacterales bacterium]
FVKNFSPFEYVDIVKDAILRFKFMDKKRYADTFAKLMVKVIKEQNYTSEFDSIVYTPMSKSSMRQRGYNQAKLLAKVVAKELDCEFINNALFKIKETLPQRELTRYKRQQNLKNAFEINQNVNIKGKTILIVDDIYTTGATIDECAKVLIKNGAKKVYSATIAVGKGFY